jgi:elongation factor Ts
VIPISTKEKPRERKEQDIPVKEEKKIDDWIDLGKFFSETCLLEQPFVKNPDITVQDLLNEMMAKTGENILIRRFARFQLGELDD